MTPKRKTPEKVEGPKGWLNRAYRYGEAHVATVALVNLGIGIVLAAVALYGFHHEGEIETRVTREVARVESKCQRYGPHSQQCHASFGAALKSLNETLTPVEARIIVCRSHLFDRLDACKKVRRIEAAAETRPAESSAPAIASTKGASAAPDGGDAISTPSTGSSQPGRHQGGSHGNGEAGQPSHPQPSPVPGEQRGGGGDVPPVAPTAPSSESSSHSSSSQTTERSTETVVEAPAPTPAPEVAKAPVREGVGAAVEGVGHVVEEAGGAVNETVHGAGCAVTGLLGASCE